MLDDENSASDSSQEQGSKKLDLLYGWGTVTVAPYSLARRIDVSDFSRQEPDFRSVGIGRADDRSTGRSQLHHHLKHDTGELLGHRLLTEGAQEARVAPGGLRALWTLSPRPQHYIIVIL